MSNSEELPTQHTTPQKTILIVEDDPSIGEMFVQTLAEENIYNPVLVESGTQGLEIVQEIIPDLLLLDYHLPSMTGLELYDKIHTMPHLSHVPAILITAGVLQHDIQDRHMVGMSKPVDLNKLLDIVAELLD
jgi:CheY-like chemotaxis protein